MEKKYSQTIVAGLIGGIVIAIWVVIFAAKLSALQGVIGLFFDGELISILAASVPGVLAVYFARGSLDSKKSTMFISFLAGAISGIVASVILAVVAIVISLTNVGPTDLTSYIAISSPSDLLIGAFVIGLYMLCAALVSTVSGTFTHIVITSIPKKPDANSRGQ